MIDFRVKITIVPCSPGCQQLKNFKTRKCIQEVYFFVKVVIFQVKRLQIWILHRSKPNISHLNLEISWKSGPSFSWLPRECCEILLVNRITGNITICYSKLFCLEMNFIRWNNIFIKKHAQNYVKWWFFWLRKIFSSNFDL